MVLCSTSVLMFYALLCISTAWLVNCRIYWRHCLVDTITESHYIWLSDEVGCRALQPSHRSLLYYLYLCLFLLSISLSLCVFISLSLPNSLCLCLFPSPNLCLFLSLTLSLSVSFSISPCLSLSVSLYFSI